MGVGSQIEKLHALVGKLRGLLLDESVPLSMEECQSSMTQSHVRDIKAARADVKAHQESLDVKLISKIPDYDKVSQSMDLAKHQTFKWGLGKFAVNPEIRFQTDVGKKLRAKLQDVWAMESLDSAVVEYMGQEACDLIKDILSVDKKDAGKKAVDKKDAGKKGKGAAPQPAASSGTSAAAAVEPARKRCKR